MSQSHCDPVSMVNYSVDVGCMVFMRLCSVEKLSGLPPWVFWDIKTFRVGARPVTGRVTRGVDEVES